MQGFEPRKSFKITGCMCSHFKTENWQKEICKLKLLGPGFRVLTLELGHFFPAVVDSKDYRRAGWDGQTSMAVNEISVKPPLHKWPPHAKETLMQENVSAGLRI